MIKTQYYCAATLDGYIADADDGLGWLIGYEGSYDGEGAEPCPMSEGGPYEQFYEESARWSAARPPTSSSSTTSARAASGHTGKALLGAELARPARAEGDGDVRIVERRVTDIHEEMIAAAGDRNLWIIGGGNVASQFADAGLLDEVLLTVVPVVLGAGKPLFDRPLPGGPMQLTGTRPSRAAWSSCATRSGAEGPVFGASPLCSP